MRIRTLTAAGLVAVLALPASAEPFDAGKLSASELDSVRAGQVTTMLSRTDVLRIVEDRAETQPIRAGSGGVRVIQRNTGRNARLSSSIDIEIRNRGGDVGLGSLR